MQDTCQLVTPFANESNRLILKQFFAAAESRLSIAVISDSVLADVLAESYDGVAVLADGHTMPISLKT